MLGTRQNRSRAATARLALLLTWEATWATLARRAHASANAQTVLAADALLGVFAVPALGATAETAAGFRFGAAVPVDVAAADLKDVRLGISLWVGAHGKLLLTKIAAARS